MKSFFLQLLCLSGLVTLLSDCRGSDPTAEGAIIDTAIPNGLVPGSALTLKGRKFSGVKSLEFANTSVPVASFIRNITDEITVKVPATTQAGPVRVATEAGPGQVKQMALLTGSDPLNPGNISTSVNTVTQGYFSDLCSPRWFVFCLRGTPLIFYNLPRSADSNCAQYFFTTEQILGDQYYVYKNNVLTLKCEVKPNSTGLTGLVIVETADGNTYFGNILKNGDIVSYSVRDGSQLKLCKSAFSGQGGDNIGRPQQATCTSCS